MRNRIAFVVSAMLMVGLLVGLTTSASAGAGDPGATAAKKKKKVCPAGTHKVVVKKKNGKKKKTCVADTPVPTPTTPTPPTPPAPPTTLAISPTNFTYPGHNHTGAGAACGDCPSQGFVVTNTGAAPSGTPSASLTEVTQPVTGAHGLSFFVTANTCTAALPPGSSCIVTVLWAPESNAGDGHYVSVLHVSASPGTDAPATIDGTTTD